MAIASGAPLVPVKLEGSFEIYPPHRAFPKVMPRTGLKRQTMHLHFGQPIYPDGSLSAQELTERLEQAVRSLGNA
jgi:1-acyl-sn-glycerol-3-phosphate acyltransferase